MENISRYDSYIAFAKRQRIVFKFHHSAVTVTNADLEAIVEMKSVAPYIGNTPFVTCKDECREIFRQFINTIFNRSLQILCHGINHSAQCFLSVYHT